MWCGAGSVHGQLRRLSIMYCSRPIVFTTATATTSVSASMSHCTVSHRLPAFCRLSSSAAPSAADVSSAPLLPATQSVLPPSSDRILLSGMLFHGRHGVYSAERELGQKFVVDVALSLNLTRPALTGVLTDSVDYGAVYRSVRRVVESEQYTLLEEVSWHIIAAVMADWQRVERIAVRVKKPHVAVEGAVDYLGVEMERSRAQWQADLGTAKHRKRKKDITQLPIE